MSLKKFTILLMTYLLLGIYVLSVAFKGPLVSVEITLKDDRWIILNIENEEWAAKYNLAVGDEILSIDGEPIPYQSRFLYDGYIREAEHLEIQKKNGEAITIPIHYEDFTEDWYLHGVIPAGFFILTFAAAIYLHKKKSTIPSINLLITFILAVSLAYSSSSASAHLNLIGLITNSTCLLLTLVLLLEFVKHYLHYWQIPIPFRIYTKWSYFLPVIALVLRVISYIVPSVGVFDSILILGMALALVIYILIIFAITYWHNRLVQLHILFVGLLVPFLPFVLFYTIPEILFQQPLVDADICALFLLLIPINVVVFHLTERLYDLKYYVTRLRYYFVIGCIFAGWLSIGLFLMTDYSAETVILFALFVISSTIIMFYIKEAFDYRARKVLFAPQGKTINQLYQIVQRLATVYKVEEILQVLTQEIAKHLEMKNIFIMTYDFSEMDLQNTAKFTTSYELNTLLKLSTGSIYKNEYYYIATIHEDSNNKRWLVMDHKQNIRLKQEELLWLELILTYTSMFIENTKIIEDLIDELHSLKKERPSEPMWMKKLLWFQIEEEKFKLAQDLHDSILQENIAIARQFDFLLVETRKNKVHWQLAELHEQMLNSIQQLRSYCETLKPPLLYQLGIHVALERLAEKAQARSNFALYTTFDRLYIEDEQTILSIYRIVQELLNNAVKHSKATVVEIYVLDTEQGVEIVYKDNGVGCEMDEIDRSESFGIYGIKERVSTLNGVVTITSAPNKGFTMQILLKESENSYGFNFNRG